MGALALGWVGLLAHCGSAQTSRTTNNASPATQLSSGRVDASRPANATQAPLPETPGRQAIVDAMREVIPAVQACGRIQHGEAQVQFVFEGPSGAAIAVTVAGSLAGSLVGTPLAACIENAVRGAQVHPFRRATFNVNFPFRF